MRPKTVYFICSTSAKDIPPPVCGLTDFIARKRKKRPKIVLWMKCTRFEI